MKIKRLAFLTAVLCIACSLAACTSVSLNIENEQLDFLKADMSDGYAGVTPEQGNSVLIVRFAAQNDNPDLTRISEGFFSQNPSTISDGANTYPCKSIAFEKDGGKLIVLPIFEVPASLAGSGTTLKLSGNAFSPIEFKV